MELQNLKPILEAAIMASDSPVDVERLTALFALIGEATPSLDEINAALVALQTDYADHGIELVLVAGGYRFQTRQQYADWVNRLWEERKPRYSRALLETMAIIAYRQPITRGEIEAIRGVAVSTGIIKTLHEREWVKIVGHRDVPGRPAIYATTRQFLEYFGLASLSALPTLAELKDFDDVNPDLFAELESAIIIDLPEELAVEPGSNRDEAENSLSAVP
ncbi:MAG: SMC-Scp complex subunit ScpB [Gammaproteobacteria bacterium]|nr:SMC-Scp complex subunit ScpB [Gammaproteobacteria bacterium]